MIHKMISFVNAVTRAIGVLLIFAVMPAAADTTLDRMLATLMEFKGGGAVRALESHLESLIAAGDTEGVKELYEPIRDKLDAFVQSFFELDPIGEPEVYSALKSSVNECEMAGIALWTFMNVIVDGGEKPIIRDGTVMIDGSLKDEEFNLRMTECASAMGWTDYKPKIGKDGSCLTTAFFDGFSGSDKQIQRSAEASDRCKDNPDYNLMQGLDGESLVPDLSDTP